MLLETVGQMQEKEELSGAVRENLEKKLLWAGVEAKRIYMTENKNWSQTANYGAQCQKVHAVFQ